MSGDIHWEDPPPRLNKSGQGYDWPAIAKALMERPGEWAVVAVCPSRNTAGSTAWNVKNGTYGPLRRGDFDATSRMVDGEARVYARYVGEPS